MIIQELDAEVEAYEACAADLARQRSLEESRDRLEDELRFLSGPVPGAFPPDLHHDAERQRVKRALERVRAELRANVSRIRRTLGNAPT